jgi:hypothetical protein
VVRNPATAAIVILADMFGFSLTQEVSVVLDPNCRGFLPLQIRPAQARRSPEAFKATGRVELITPAPNIRHHCASTLAADALAAELRDDLKS